MNFKCQWMLSLPANYLQWLSYVYNEKDLNVHYHLFGLEKSALSANMGDYGSDWRQ